MNSLESKALDEVHMNHRLEVSTHISDKARVADSLDSIIGEVHGKYRLEVSTHPSEKVQIVGAYEAAWFNGNIVGAHEQESAWSDDIVGVLETIV